MSLQGEPYRKDGQIAVYMKYSPNFTYQASRHFNLVREGIGKVYEQDIHQAKQEQLNAQPEQKTQERKQELTKTRRFAIID